MSINWMEILKDLDKPLRPIWFHPGTRIFSQGPIDYIDSPFYPVILYCASDPENGQLNCLRRGFSYVQGGGDDHESWCPAGFDRNVFWAHATEILESRESCLPAIQRLSASETSNESSQKKGVLEIFSDQFDFISDTLAVGSRQAGRSPMCWDHFDIVLNLSEFEYEENLVSTELFTRYGDCEELKPRVRVYIHVPPSGKNRISVLKDFDTILAILERLNWPRSGKKLLIQGDKGKDRSVTTALLLILKNSPLIGIDKNQIRSELVRIQSHRREANPSRFHLKSLTSFFLGTRL